MNEQQKFISSNLPVSSSAKGGLRKIKDAEQPCLSPQHKPPMHIYLTAGTYEYTCPSCGKVVVFTVPLIIC